MPSLAADSGAPSLWRLAGQVDNRHEPGAVIFVDDGPTAPPSGRPGMGFTNPRCLRYAAEGAFSLSLAAPTVTVVRELELTWAVYPELGPPEALHRNTAVGLEVVLDDGTRVGADAVDQYGDAPGAASQGRARKLIPEQWNLRRMSLDSVAGRVIVEIRLAGEPHESPGRLSGWLDSVEIRPVATPTAAAGSLADLVRTTRGTHSSAAYSRGNCLPISAVPRGFSFATPVTDASSLDWIYSWSAHNDAKNWPRLQAFAVSHLASPWMGDWGTLQFFPWASSRRPDPDRQSRSLAFDHRDETDRPHRYEVTFQEGMSVGIAPTNHGLLAEFRFPGPHGAVIFDNITNDGTWSWDGATRSISGSSDVRGAWTEDAPRMFYWASFDRPVVAAERFRESDRPDVCGFVRLDLDEGFTARMRLGTSNISVEQARLNVEREIPPTDTFATVAERARHLWEEDLGSVEIDGATEDQLTTFYSGLYRLFLYPNDQSEQLPDGQRVSVLGRGDSYTMVDGGLTVNNGFWDTYRTCWPLYALLRPRIAADLFDSVLTHVELRGWLPRWSAPGAADMMVGTSSDVIAADLLARGVDDFDVIAAYDAALVNATVISADPAVGRKGLSESLFRGYTSTDIPEGLSWTLEGALNDFGIARHAEWLLNRFPTHPRAVDWRAEQRWFSHRARAHRLLFDPETGFFRGRRRDGAWRGSAAEFDPLQWGGDYTETDAWNMLFSTPHDTVGLLELHGGRAGLAARLTELFDEPGTAEDGRRGSYPFVIHEMSEARDVRHGLLGLSNQPSHHIPYMWMFAGRPHRTQAIVRDCVRRLWVGSDAGQGYLGDEDNGEMSGWYVFSALGLYPMEVGTARYLITSPLFARARIRVGDDLAFTVETSEADGGGDYIQAVKLNGEPLERAYLEHAEIVAGGTLSIVLGPKPTGWGSHPGALPARGWTALPPEDATRGSVVTVDGRPESALTDDVADSSVDVPTGGEVLLVLSHELSPAYYTVSCGKPEDSGHDWVFEGSLDGVAWKQLDRRSDVAFSRPNQTRVFDASAVSAQPSRFFRLINTGPASIALMQLQLFADE